MMRLGLEEQIAEAEQLTEEGRYGQADAAMRQVLIDLHGEDLENQRERLEHLVSRFPPKRRRDLGTLLNTHLISIRPSQGTPTASVPPAIPRTSASSPALGIVRVQPEQRDVLRRWLRPQLQDLGNRFLFQWRPYYLRVISEIFDKLLHLEDLDAVGLSALCITLREEFAFHATAVYQKGYDQMVKEGSTTGDPQWRAMNGLQQFLELPVLTYSSRLRTIESAKKMQMLRPICSAMLSGIIAGFCRVNFDATKGQVLLDHPNEYWANSLAFLTGVDVAYIAKTLGQGDLRVVLQHVLVPLARAIDQVSLITEIDRPSLPAVGIFDPRDYKLDIYLLLPPSTERGQYLVVECFLKQPLTAPDSLTQAFNRGVLLVVSILAGQLRNVLATQEALKQIVIDVDLDDASSATKVENTVVNLLSSRLKEISVEGRESSTLLVNYAAVFPIWVGKVPDPYFVERPSVQKLLSSIENLTGIRVWCSPRRSGKTTAASRLKRHTGALYLVNQTAQQTSDKREYMLSSALTEAMKESELPQDFFKSTVAKCTPGRVGSSKIVFVLDEYEQLFGRLSSYIEERPGRAHTHVHPLLNQMVIFSENNLLVFLGQQPDAHAIEMVFNQLTPRVRQDPFPLFSYEDGQRSEFENFVELVLTRNLQYDSSFLELVYDETGGHPFLTQNHLQDFCQWLIDTRRPMWQRRVTGEDYKEFARTQLQHNHLSISRHYNTYRDIVKANLTTATRRDHPWLYATHVLLKQLVLFAPIKLSCSRDQFNELIKQHITPLVPEQSPNTILSAGTLANFLVLSGDVVRPRIPLLARLCAATDE